MRYVVCNTCTNVPASVASAISWVRRTIAIQVQDGAALLRCVRIVEDCERPALGTMVTRTPRLLVQPVQAAWLDTRAVALGDGEHKVRVLVEASDHHQPIRIQLWRTALEILHPDARLAVTGEDVDHSQRHQLY